MQEDDVLWGFNPQKRGRDESFECPFADLAFSASPLRPKVTRTRSIGAQPLERVSSQISVMDMLDFAEHRHMLHVSESFGDLRDLGAGLECSSNDLHCPMEGEQGVPGCHPDAGYSSMYGSESSDVVEVVDIDEERFKLVSLLGYRRSLALASAGSRHVASGVPFMSPDAIQYCLVPKPDLVQCIQELERCF